jgi:phage/plasmid-like protein (TIGR03299 family)
MGKIMAHEITSRDGVFAVRNAMWHGLGTVLPDYPTHEEAQAIAHPWEPITEDLYRKVLEIKSHCHTDDCVPHSECGLTEDFIERYEVSETAKLNVRSDDGFELGPVSPGYVTVNNSTMYDIAEAIEGLDKGAVQYETGGSLAGGRRVWLLLRLTEPIKIIGDPHGSVIPYFALQNAHDGSASFRGQAIADRIVCANSARLADMFAQTHSTEFTFSHTRNVMERIDQARQALAGWRQSVNYYQHLGDHLVTMSFDEEQQSEFLSRFIPMPPPSTCTERVARNVDEARVAVLGFLHSQTCEGIENTAWGMVQASVEYLNWGRRAHTAETRFKRSFLDASELTATAVTLVKDIAGVPA